MMSNLLLVLFAVLAFACVVDAQWGYGPWGGYRPFGGYGYRPWGYGPGPFWRPPPPMYGPWGPRPYWG
ncbi:unnamed protein product [Haemonchus placei]|uniref:Sulfur globule protein CV1 domain protein n=1 Tax=Haemonchus placei TaxID=6290 RepID=A0A0N4W4S0_HAEPC|nr:unnamed protein product [Haemonchus placei]